MGEKEETIPEEKRETMGHWRMLRGRTDEKNLRSRKHSRPLLLSFCFSISVKSVVNENYKYHPKRTM